MAKCKNCKHFYKRPDITMFTCAEGKPHEDNTVIDCEHYSPMTNADRIRSMTDEELAKWFDTVTKDVLGGSTWDKNGWLKWLKAESEGEYGK